MQRVNSYNPGARTGLMWGKQQTQNRLVSAPLPDPNRSRPTNITGNNAVVPRRNDPTANVDAPMRHKNENRKTPTNINKITQSLNIQNIHVKLTIILQVHKSHYH